MREKLKALLPLILLAQLATLALIFVFWLGITALNAAWHQNAPGEVFFLGIVIMAIIGAAGLIAPYIAIFFSLLGLATGLLDAGTRQINSENLPVIALSVLLGIIAAICHLWYQPLF